MNKNLQSKNIPANVFASILGLTAMVALAGCQQPETVKVQENPQKITIVTPIAEIKPSTEQTTQMQVTAYNEGYKLSTEPEGKENFIFTDNKGQKTPLAPAAFATIKKSFVSTYGTLTTGNAPMNSEKSELVYLSTYDFLDKDAMNIQNTLYTYNLKTAELVKIYEAKNAESLYWNLWATDGSKLVLEQFLIDNSPAPCFSSTVDNISGFSYLDLKSPKDGFKKYTLPESVIAKAKLEQAACQKDWKSNTVDI